MTRDVTVWTQQARATGGAGIVDLFAGPGGWEQGLRQVDPDAHARTIGVELDEAAVATRRAAGHLTLPADVTTVDPILWSGLVDVLIASPPCQAFAVGGRRAGTDEALDAWLNGHYTERWRAGRAADWQAWEADLAAWRSGQAAGDQLALFDPPPHPGPPSSDPRGDLVAEIPRWADALRPRAIAAEQVPGVLPIWERIADEILTPAGYSTAVGIVNAADYGVPQARRRAILIARRDGTPAELPTPTHAGRHVSIDDALEVAHVYDRINTGRAWKAGGDRSDAQTVPVFLPAPTVTTVPGQWRWQAGDDLVDPVDLDQAAKLQTFPAGYPWSGDTVADLWRQVGNAVPPRLAAAILSTILTEESTP